MVHSESDRWNNMIREAVDKMWSEYSLQRARCRAGEASEEKKLRLLSQIKSLSSTLRKIFQMFADVGIF